MVVLYYLNSVGIKYTHYVTLMSILLMHFHLIIKLKKSARWMALEPMIFLDSTQYIFVFISCTIYTYCSYCVPNAEFTYSIDIMLLQPSKATLQL